MFQGVGQPPTSPQMVSPGVLGPGCRVAPRGRSASMPGSGGAMLRRVSMGNPKGGLKELLCYFMFFIDMLNYLWMDYYGYLLICFYITHPTLCGIYVGLFMDGLGGLLE